MQQPQISFEFFPPHTIEASFQLKETVQTLAPLDPRFVSVTYGAGGTTRDLTSQAIKALKKTTPLNVAAHLTCVDVSKKETLAIAEQFSKDGVTELVALRGDPQRAQFATNATCLCQAVGFRLPVPGSEIVRVPDGMVGGGDRPSVPDGAGYRQCLPDPGDAVWRPG